MTPTSQSKLSGCIYGSQVIGLQGLEFDPGLVIRTLGNKSPTAWEDLDGTLRQVHENVMKRFRLYIKGSYHGSWWCLLEKPS